MNIDDKLIDKVAGLAKLEFEGEEKENIKKDLSRMLDFVENLKAVDTNGIEPLIYITEEKGRLRKDESAVTISKADALKNAPQKDSFYFKVPKVLKK